MRGKTTQGLLSWTDTPHRDRMFGWLNFLMITASNKKSSVTLFSTSIWCATFLKTGFISFSSVLLHLMLQISLYWTKRFNANYFWDVQNAKTGKKFETIKNDNCLPLIIFTATICLKFGHWFRTADHTIPLFPVKKIHFGTNHRAWNNWEFL